MLTVNITESELEEFFPFIDNPINLNAAFDGKMFETYGEEVEFVIAQPENTVWTLIDGDDGAFIKSGMFFVNRLGYFVSTNPVPDNVEYIFELKGGEL